MPITLDPETERTLRMYAEGELTVIDLAAWLVSAHYDEGLPLAERDELARLDLVVHESMEKLRPVEEVMETVRDLLASSTSS